MYQQSEGDKGNVMKPAGLLGGLIGSIIGAVIWAAIVHFAEYEVGFVAWAVGGLVGIGAVKFGGRGQTLAIACAIIALASIFCGKVAAYKLMLDGTDPERQADLTQVVDLALNTLGTVDVLFGLLGVGTAYSLVRKAGEERETEDQEADAEEETEGEQR